jgi:hypothetical protein
MVRPAALALIVVLGLTPSCASTVVAVQDRTVRDAELAWRPATAPDLAGAWRARSIEGPAAAVLMDLAYWIDADGRFSGAALFVGPPPAYEVLSGTWTLAEEGALQLGAEAALALAEVADGLLRLSGDEGRLVFQRSELR